MRVPSANKSVTATAVPVDELCPGCRARAAGLGVGPFTPSEWMEISPTIESTTADPVSNDPGVVVAQQAAVDARATWEKADLVWQEALLAHREARLRVNGDSDTDRRAFRLQALEAAVHTAEEERDAVHEEQVVPANVRVREAQARARNLAAGV